MALWRQRLDDVRLQEQQLDANVQRLGRESVALEARVSKDVSRRARNQEALRKFQDLKTRSRALLTAANYRWPDDSPFVRIPKWALPSIKVPGPTTAEKLQAKITSFLDLTPAELAVTSQLFSKYNTETDRLLEHGLSETNQSPDLSLPSGAESRVFIMEPLGQKIRNALDQLCNELAAIMGEDRWGKIKPSQYELNDSEQTRLLGYGSDKWEQRQEIAVNIFVKPGSDPTVNYVAPGGAGCGPIPLRMFLGGNAEFMFEGGGLPQAAPKLIERVKHYISEQAVARLSTSVPK